MPLNTRNLVVILIDGRTMHNLGTHGLEQRSEPVPGSFELIHHLVANCVGEDNVCVIFTHVNGQHEREVINRWLLKHDFFRRTGLHYRYINLVFLADPSEKVSIAEFVRSSLVKEHTHVLVISDSWDTFDGMRFEEVRTVTRILLDPAPAEEAKYRHSIGTWLLKEWNDIRQQTTELLKL